MTSLEELKAACQNPRITDQQIYNLFCKFTPEDEEEFDEALNTVMINRPLALETTITTK